MNNVVMNGTYEAEGWIPIPNYEDYHCSNLGNVKRIKGISSTHEHPITPRKRKDGYYYIRLNKNGCSKSFALHRLVAQLFVPNPDKLPVATFKDKDKLNCRWDNLKWVERYDLDYSFLKDAKKVPRAGEKNGHAKITQKEADEIKQLLKEGLSTSEIVKQVKNATIKIVWNIKSGKSWKDNSDLAKENEKAEEKRKS